MSVSAIPSSILSQYQYGATSPLQQEFQQLGQALQSNNLSAAQSDFTALEQAFSSSSSTSSTTATTTTANPITQAFNQLASDLQSGNLSAAQKDYSTLQQDLQSQGTSFRHQHGHHHVSSSGTGDGGDSSATNPLLQDLNQIGQDLSANNLSGGQQAYATLQQQFQQFALGNTDLTDSNSLPTQAAVSLEV